MKILVTISFSIFLTVFIVTAFKNISAFKIIVCDVGQGDGILISKGDWQAIVDAGPDNSMLMCLGKYMPFWDKKIELAVITHPQLDHFGGLIDILNYYQVEVLVTNPHKNETIEYLTFLEKTKSNISKIYSPKKGILARSKDMEIEILSSHNPGVFGEEVPPTDPNTLSIVMLLTYGANRILLTGDVDTQTLGGIVAKEGLKNIDLLKVPHHGSKNNLSMEILKTLKPKYAAISVGENTYGHPHAETIKMLQDSNMLISSTRETGDILYLFAK